MRFFCASVSPRSARVPADGATLIGFGDAFLLVWNTGQSEPQERLRLPGRITCAAINESGSAAIAGTASGEVFVLRLPDLKVLAHRREPTAIHSVQVSDVDVGVFCDVEGHVAAFNFANNEDLPPIRYDGAAARLWLACDANLLIVDDQHTMILCDPKKGWLENTFYYGAFEYPRDSGNWYQGIHKPIITQ